MSDEARPRRFPRHDTWKGRATRFLCFSLDIGQNRTLGKFIIIIIISIITFVVSIFAPFPCQTDSLPMRYDSPKPHQFFPGVQVLSQASNITGIRSRSEASIPAAGSREPFVWRARPLVLRCCGFITCSWFAGAFCMASSTAFPPLLYSVPFPAIPLPAIPSPAVPFPAVSFPIYHMPRHPFSQSCAFPAAQSLLPGSSKQQSETKSNIAAGDLLFHSCSHQRL